VSLHRALHLLHLTPSVSIGELPATEEGVEIAQGIIEALRLDLVDYDEAAKTYTLSPVAVLMVTAPVRLAADRGRVLARVATSR